MTVPGCERLTFAMLADYAAGALSDDDAASVEEHLFACAACGARTNEVEYLVQGIRNGVRSGAVGGFVTDAILNQLAREGMRLRTFTLSPGAIVPCAVWDGDELMALRLRADFGSATEFTLTQQIAGAETVRATTQVDAAAHGELIFATPAAWIRRLPEIELALVLTARDGNREREIASYTLSHGGALRR